jgi:hypothetical protein
MLYLPAHSFSGHGSRQKDLMAHLGVRIATMKEFSAGFVRVAKKVNRTNTLTLLGFDED